MTQTALTLNSTEYSLTEQRQAQRIEVSPKNLQENEEARISAFPLREGKSTLNQQDLREADAKLETTPSLREVKAQSRFIALQKWEGYVLRIGEETFTARLLDLKNRGLEEEAEIYRSEVTEEDRLLLQPGAIFYWSIGYLDHYSGQRFNTGLIRFRRLPGFSKQEIRLAQEKAQEIRRLFGWDNL